MPARPAQPASATVTTTAAQKVRVWDLPTRLFHWLLALAIVALVVTAKVGGNAMHWHLQLGQAVLALLIFRLLWGVFGGRWSRFAHFVYAPGTLLRYLRGQGTPEHSAGHSPLGALSVWAMLLVLLAQVASGLLSDDEIAFSGPLTRFASGDTVSLATHYHAHWGQYLIYALMGLHLLAVVYYSLQRRGLVRAMITGDKRLAEPVPPASDTGASRLLAAFLALLASGLSWWVQQLGAAASF